MKKGWILCLILAVTLLGCSSTALQNVGDGKVDEVEASIIRVSVGAALTAFPQAIAPAYAVSTALLQGVDAGQLVELGGLQAAAESKIDKLDLQPNERQSAIELYGVIKAEIKARLDKLGVAAPEQRLVVVRTIIQIVKEAAGARLGLNVQKSTRYFDTLQKRLVEQAESNRREFIASAGFDPTHTTVIIDRLDDIYLSDPIPCCYH